MPGPESPASAAGCVTDPADELLGEIERMAALARDGEWLRMQRLAATLDARIGRLADSRRQDTLAAAHTGIERLSALAISARNEIGEKLKTIRNGRKATQSYRATGAR